MVVAGNLGESQGRQYAMGDLWLPSSDGPAARPGQIQIISPPFVLNGALWPESVLCSYDLQPFPEFH